MLRDINLSKGMLLQNRQDIPAIMIPDTFFNELYQGEGEHFMVEAVNMADIESTYFYDVPVLIEQNAQMFEAITSTRARLSGSMRAFIRALNQSLNGSGITAGNDTSGESDDGSQAMGGANIGRVRKVQGLAVMPAIIPLSDGQTVTLVFHSPTGNASSITATDTLVAFQFLLNKKDVTHVVSPSNGRDISLKVVTTALSNLIERNTAKFQHAQAKQNAIKAEIATMQEAGDKLEEQQASLVEQGDQMNASIQADSQTLSDLTNKADKQDELNIELQSQLAAAQQKKDDAAAAQMADRKARADALTSIQAKSGYKDTYVANWAYNQNIPTGDLTDLASRLDTVDVSDLKDLIMYKGQVSDLSDIPALKARNSVPPPSNDPGPRSLYWYGLRARPAGPGALPQEPKPAVIATVEEAAELPIVKAKDFDPSDYRNGAVAYASPLDAGDVAQFELVDFQKKQTTSSFNALLNDLIPLIQAYPGNENAFYLDYLADDAPKADKLPQSMKDAGGFQTIRQNMGSKASLRYMEFFKQVKKDNPAPPPAPVDDTPKPDDNSGVQLSDGDTVPLESIQTGAAMPTIAKGATSGDNPIWYTQSTLNDIVAAAKFKINGQSATSNPEFAESRYQMVKAAMAAGFGMQRFKISGLQYIYVLRKDDEILTGKGAAKFAPPAAVPPVEQTPPVKPSKRSLVARAFEQTKGEGLPRDGRLMMWIEGPEDFIRWADKELSKDYDSADVEEDGKHEGEISVAFGVDRGDKSVFMGDWKDLKERWVNGKTDDAPTPPVAPAIPAPTEGGNNGYVSVKPTVAEAGAVADQVSALGINGGITPEKLHVTLMYSKDHSIFIQPEPGRTYLARLTGEYKIIGNAPNEALVAILDSADLKKRFDELTAAGGAHSYPEYLPHLSLKYSATPADLELIKAKGLGVTSIHLSGETFKAIDDTPAKPAPIPDPVPVPDVTPDNEMDTFGKAAALLASFTGHSVDSISNWADGQHISNDELMEMADKLAVSASQENISRVKSAIDFGSPFPTLKEAAPVTTPPPVTDPEPPKTEADSAAQKAIDYLKEVAQMNSGDMIEIRTARGNVRAAITALTDAGVYEENEDLVNAAAQKLSDLLAAVARGAA
jgi:hypothetical protein